MPNKEMGQLRSNLCASGTPPGCKRVFKRRPGVSLRVVKRHYAQPSATLCDTSGVNTHLVFHHASDSLEQITVGQARHSFNVHNELTESRHWVPFFNASMYVEA